MIGRRSRPTGVVGIDRFVRDVEHGRFERTLSGLTALSALVTGAEIFLEHDRASFGNKMMWIPVALTPLAAAAGAGGVASQRLAKTVLPAVSAVVVANGVQGTYLHVRGIAQRPGGWRYARFNAETGPPLFAPLLFSVVGGMGILAAILRRERRWGSRGPMTVPARGLRPRTPSSCGSLAVARPTGHRRCR